jgi:hypothetical protein
MGVARRRRLPAWPRTTAWEERTASARATLGLVLSFALDSVTLRLNSSTAPRLHSVAPGSIRRRWGSIRSRRASIQRHQVLIRCGSSEAGLRGLYRMRGGAGLLARCRRKRRGRSTCAPPKEEMIVSLWEIISATSQESMVIHSVRLVSTLV